MFLGFLFLLSAWRVFPILSSGCETGYYPTEIFESHLGFSAVVSNICLKQSLSVEVFLETDTRLHLKVQDILHQDWEIPESILSFPKSIPITHTNLSIDLQENPFGFRIRRNQDIIFSTLSTNWNFSHNYIHFPISVEKDPHIYGLGEHVAPLRLPTNQTYTMWARDLPTPPHTNLYGSHPFYLQIISGKAHGVFLRNSNGMDVVLSDDQIVFNILGGPLEMFVFAGESPQEVVQQYSEVIGRPKMPPRWSLGWHQCRFGFKNLSEVETCVNEYRNHGIPLDTIWNDLDYMDHKEDFTWDPVHYPLPEVQRFVQTLHENGQHYVTLVDPGIHAREGYESFERGLQMDVFIKNADNSVFLGSVWPGRTAFPDFLHPDASQYWKEEIRRFLDQVHVDGLWIDMNEISNFCSGDCRFGQQTHIHFPYSINNGNAHEPLLNKTISPDALHFGGVQEYRVHNLYGLLEAIATNKALEELTGKRSFSLSRSTFPGSGSHTFHWLGDNHATWQSMRDSIPGILRFGMFGIPLVGADIGGFLLPPSEELSVRWHALGAFYPFSRNHKDTRYEDDFPYRWPSLTLITKKVLAAKYTLLPYWYTLFYQAHISGGAVARPMFFEFPSDPQTWSIDNQFMVGPALLVIPCLEEGVLSISGYVPSGRWFDYWTNELLVGRNEWFEFSAKWDEITVLVRGGFILPIQGNGMTTREVSELPFSLMVYLDEELNAFGELYWDDGEQLKVGDASSSSFIKYQCNKYSCSSEILFAGAQLPPLKQLIVLGLDDCPTVVSGIQATINCPSPGKLILTPTARLDMLTPFSLNFVYSRIQ